MGVNNKARRAVKAKQRAKNRRINPPGGGSGLAFDPGHGPWCPPGCADQGLDDGVALSFALVAELASTRADPRSAEAAATRLLAGGPQRRRAVRAEISRLLRVLAAAVVSAGWTPFDLAEIVRRRAGSDYLSLLTHTLQTHAAGFAADRIAPAWRTELDMSGPAAAVDPELPSGLARMLVLAGVLDALPLISEVIPPPGRGQSGPGANRAAGVGQDDKQLARVRALLAKAESTQYDAEAEALTAKAQELISRYALQRLLDRADAGLGAPPVSARRIWIEAPYVLPKAMLVDAVAVANRCQAVISESLGFTTVVGEPRDLDAVELLSTSLLVQANAAVLRHGRQATCAGTSRTRSFRRSFLVSYATRIGERLTESTCAVERDSADRDRLLPVLRASEEAVREEFERRFPSVVHKASNITDARGWAAGRAAADLALLDVNGQLASAAVG